MADLRFIRWFCDISIADVGLVGGKNASLGEMLRELVPQGIRIPNGFAITANAYRAVLEVGGLGQEIRAILADLDTRDLSNLAERGRRVREVILTTPLPAALQQEISEAYVTLGAEYGPRTDVAVRSSATAEDLPTPASPGSRSRFSTFAVSVPCSMRVGSAWPRCSPTARSRIAWIRALTISRWRFRSACRRWCVLTSGLPA